jgi:hypothetical protein
MDYQCGCTNFGYLFELVLEHPFTPPKIEGEKIDGKSRGIYILNPNKIPRLSNSRFSIIFY